MSRGCWRIKPGEIERTVKILQKTGLHVRSVEVGPDGTIKINLAETGEPNPAAETSEMLRKLI